MRGRGGHWRCGQALCAGGGVRLSFQRYVRPEDGLAPVSPRSLGALPVASDGRGAAMLPVAGGEAFWIGLSVEPPATRAVLAIAAIGTDGSCIDVMTGEAWPERAPGVLSPPRIVVPDCRWIDGVGSPGSARRAFVRPAPDSGEGGWTGLLVRVLESGDAVAEPIPSAGQRTEGMWTEVVFAAPADFVSATGCPYPPLDPAAAYGGWRLP